jgi:beta-1,4-mannosyl-glycoprotein beta-1,4-N-acetylglucosaminyltransferase
MVVVDSFIFYNELDILECRLKTLNDVVDYFVLVEATKTFMGNDKPLYYLENKDRYSNFNKKIIHVVVDNLKDHTNINTTNNDQWENERTHRRAIDNGLLQIELDDNDLIIITDVDEIPDPNTISNFKSSLTSGIYTLVMDLYYYNIECKFRDKWTYPKITTYGFYKIKRDPQYCRELNCYRIDNCGWHLSYFGDKKFIENKIKNFSHCELNRDDIIQNIEDKIKNKIDLFGRSDCVFDYIKKTDNTYLPPFYPDQ